jgi:hypothetical protein
MFNKRKKADLPTHHRSTHLWRGHRKGWVGVLGLLMAATTLVQFNASHLQLSLLTIPEPLPFDGLVYPIQEHPDWVNATASELDLHFSDFPSEKLIDTPTYDASRLSLSSSDLEWGNVYDDYTRHMKITYSVPYSGTYMFDGVEGLGSHPGVDIKNIKGAPVYSIGNGIIERVTYSGSGFGNLVVVKHVDVPDPNLPSITTTLYSGYAHNEDIFVTEGQVVTKGQQIASVGDTGTATTDHLHFQIDNDLAPWHLYWPFTSSEANAVGGFWDAVNSGVGQDNVKAYTVNPFDYIHDYLDVDAVMLAAPEADVYSAPEEVVVDAPIVEEVDDIPTEIVVDEVVVSADITDVSDIVIDSPSVSEEVGVEVAEIEIEVEEEEEEEEEEEVYVPPFYDMVFDYKPYMLPGSRQSVKVSLVDERGEFVTTPSYNSPIYVVAEDSDVLKPFPTELKSHLFTKGYTYVDVKALDVGVSSLSFTFLGREFLIGDIFVADEVKPLSTFSIETDGEFYVGSTEEIAIVALNEDGERVIDFNLVDPILLTVLEGTGYFSRTALLDSDFEDGIAVVEFTPIRDENVIFGLTSNDISITSSLFYSKLFSDVDDTNSYYNAIHYLKSTGVVSGYDDETFQPDKLVSRVELLKMVYVAFQKDIIEDGEELAFPDVDSSAWYAPYLAAAFDEGIVSGDATTGLFRPGDNLNRVELIKILTLSLGVDVDPVVIGKPFEDVHYLEWYAPYAQFGKDSNILPWSEDVLNAGDFVTRGEVAEMIYRVLAIQKNGTDSYTASLALD